MTTKSLPTRRSVNFEFWLSLLAILFIANVALSQAQTHSAPEVEEIGSNPSLPEWLRLEAKKKRSAELLLKSTRKLSDALASPAACVVTATSVGSSPTGTLTTDDCLDQGAFYYDIYTFTVTANQTVSIRMNSTAVDAYLVLLNSSGTVLLEDDDSGGGTNSHLRYTFTTAGTYRVWATSFSAFETGAYNLSLSTACPQSPINLGDTFTGSLTTGDCQPFAPFGGFVDEYVFDGSPGQNVIFTVRANNYGTYMELRNLAGLFIDFESASSGQDTIIAFTVTDEGPFTLEVGSFSSSTPGTYTLSARPAVTFSGQLQNENGQPIDCLTFGGGEQRPEGLNGDLVPCQLPMAVSCANGFSTTYFVTSIFSILVPQNSGLCTLTPLADPDSQFGVTSWSPSFITLSSSQSQSGFAFAAAGPQLSVTGTINPSAEGVRMRLFLMGGNEIPNRCTVDVQSRIYTCNMTKFSSYIASPFHTSLSSDPASRSYTQITNPPPVNTHNYTMIAVPTLSIADATATEGDSGTAPMTFTVTLSIPQSQDVTVNYSTTDGTALAGADYQAVSNGTVTIPAGQTSTTATVQIIGDTVVDPAETFLVNLSNSQGANIGDSSALGIINDNDQAGSIRFSAVAYSVNENAGSATITVERTGGAASGVSVICRTTAGGTATAGQDYTPIAQTLTFAAGVTSQTCTVPIANDGVAEPNETVRLVIDTPSGGASVTFPTEAELTILGAATRPTLFDYDGDRRSDLSVLRPSNRNWYLLREVAGFTAMQWGVAGDLLAPADYDGDGKTDIAVFRPSSGTWYVYMSQSLTFQQFSWGAPGDVVVPTDRDADGKTDLVVYRSSNNTWYRRNISTGAISTKQFGITGDRPVVGDFDGDGRGDDAVFRPSNSTWYIQMSQVGYRIQTWGQTGDIPVPADYDGDAKTDIAIFRPSTNQWYRIRSNGGGFEVGTWGQSGDVPAPADFNGDGKTDLAVFRPANATWYILHSGGIATRQFGQNGDIPTQSAYIGLPVP